MRWRKKHHVKILFLGLKIWTPCQWKEVPNSQGSKQWRWYRGPRTRVGINPLFNPQLPDHSGPIKIYSRTDSVTECVLYCQLEMALNDLMSKVSKYYWSNKKNSYDPSLRMVWPQMFYPQHGALMVASTAAHKSAGFGLKIRWQSQSEKSNWRFPHFF